MLGEQQEQSTGWDKLSSRDVAKHLLQQEYNIERKNHPIDDMLSQAERHQQLRLVRHQSQNKTPLITREQAMAELPDDVEISHFDYQQEMADDRVIRE